MRKNLRKKVIIIIYKQMETFEYEKYGGTIFEKYFDVEVWNLSEIFWKAGIKAKDLYPLQKQIGSIKEFVMYLRKYSRKRTFLVFFMMPQARKTFYFQAAVSLMGFSYSMTYPQPCLAKWNCGSLKKDLEIKKTDYLNALLNALFPPSFNFLATETCYKEFPSNWSIKKQKNILIHTLDYDVYLKIKNERERLIEDKYILFLDDNYVQNSTFRILGVGFPFKEPEDYYGPVKRLFDKIEELFGYQVVIAEHPRSHYSDKTIYGNRKMIRGETARLIRDAEMVLCHKTMALDYVILFQKNFLLVYLEEFKRFYQWESYYVPFFNYLKIQGLNISKPYSAEMIENRIVSGVSKEHEKYKQYYIKAKGTEKNLFFEVVSRYIRRR